MTRIVRHNKVVHVVKEFKAIDGQSLDSSKARHMSRWGAESIRAVCFCGQRAKLYQGSPNKFTNDPPNCLGCVTRTNLTED